MPANPLDGEITGQAVDHAGSYSNHVTVSSALVTALHDLQRAQAHSADTIVSVRSGGRSDQPRWVRDRFTRAERQVLVAAFEQGTPQRTLAKRYDISERTVRRIIHKEHPARAT